MSRFSRRLLPLLFTGLFVAGLFLQLAAPVLADPLPSDEIKALNLYPNWVASACASGDSGGPVAVGPGTGAPDGAEFPNLEPSQMVDSINNFIKKENSSSKLKGLGETIVADGKHAGVNPFLIVAIAREESSMASPGDYNVSNGNNAFGRMASSDQPSFPGSGPNAGTDWYKWSSVKASVDYTAQENQGISGGGDMGTYLKNEYGGSIASSDLVSLFLKYAPPSDNDTAAYIANVKGWVADMVKGAGGAGAASGSTTASAGDSSGDASACCPSSGSSGTTEAPTTPGKTTKPAAAVQKVVWDTLTAGGIDDIHTAAVMGNLAHEGVWDPTNIEDPAGQTTDRNVIKSLTGQHQGYGLMGWTPGNHLLKAMHDLGISSEEPYTAETQAQVILGQIQGKTSLYTPDIGKTFLDTKTVEAATKFYEGGYGFGFERPYDPGATQADRVADAQTFYKEFKGTSGTSAPTGGSTDTSSTCCDTGSGSSTPGATTSDSNNEATVWNYLVGTMHLSAIQAAGIMGNMEQESGFSPTATNPDTGAYGIAQWYAERNDALASFAASKGKDKSDINVQLQYLQSELDGSYKSAVLNPIKHADKLEDVVRIWLVYYEKPCLATDTSCIDDEMSNRMPFAHDVMKNYGGGTVDVSGSSDSCGGSTPTGTADLTKTVTVSTKGKFINLPSKYTCPGHTTTIDSRVAADVVYFVTTYNLCTEDGLADGHRSHGAGVSVDMVPRSGNSKQDWINSAEAAAKAIGWWGDSAKDSQGSVKSCANYGSLDYGQCMHEVYPDKFPTWMRWLGYNGAYLHGDPWHVYPAGSGPHIHISWASPNGADAVSPVEIPNPIPAVYTFPAPVPDDLQGLIGS
jgi:hypothetical protein